MVARIKKLQPKDKQIKQQDLLELQAILDRFSELDQKKRSALLWDIKRKNNLQEPDTWTFIMISPEQNRSVVQWLKNNSKRPLTALELWSVLFENVHRETGQIMLTRHELAKEIQIHTQSITNIMSELESIKAIIKKKEGRNVTYYMNPAVATHLNREERDRTSPTAPQLELIHGGKA